MCCRDWRSELVIILFFIVGPEVLVQHAQSAIRLRVPEGRLPRLPHRFRPEASVELGLRARSGPPGPGDAARERRSTVRKGAPRRADAITRPKSGAQLGKKKLRPQSFISFGVYEMRDIPPCALCLKKCSRRERKSKSSFVHAHGLPKRKKKAQARLQLFDILEGKLFCESRFKRPTERCYCEEFLLFNKGGMSSNASLRK